MNHERIIHSIGNHLNKELLASYLYILFHEEAKWKSQFRRRL